ncbi:MAG: hypothetical protein H0X24_01810 [Ktedonobacterales bacterium]|nr:hypothetical protein [Ktedonobacterales bacterium]
MPTVIDNVLTTIQDSQDEDEMQLLLGMFAGIPTEELPTEELTDILLTTDTNEDLWLITASMTEVWDTLIELLSEDADNIPEEPVIAARRHALEVVDTSDEEPDSDHDACLEHLVAFAISLPEFPADILVELLAHPRGFVRAIGLDVLYQLDREAEIVPFLSDPDEEVRTSALNKAWRYVPLTTLQRRSRIRMRRCARRPPSWRSSRRSRRKPLPRRKYLVSWRDGLRRRGPSE